jgi:dTDP-4-amino-4,6-dideoxygalactose transaminase
MIEIPPTAGLPLAWRDLFPARGADLATGLSRLLGVPSVQLECSGTSALVITLAALQRGAAGRRVIVPAYTCPLVALAVLHRGLIPVPCDLLPDSIDLDPEHLERLCDGDTLAIIPTHLGGRVADLATVLEIATRHGVAVIEDAAQSLGARWRNRPLGMVGDAGFHSLAVGKGLTTFEGGVLLARGAALRARLREVAGEMVPRSFGWELRRSLELLGYAALYRPAGLVFAYGIPLRKRLHQGRLIEAVGDDFTDDLPLHRLGGWRKAVAAGALARLADFQDGLRQQALRRLPRLAAIARLSVIQDGPDGQGTWPFFMLLLPSRRARDRVLERLWGAGLGVSRLYIHALSDYPYLAGRLAPTQAARARDFADRMLTISNSPWLDDVRFEFVAREIETAMAARD